MKIPALKTLGKGDEQVFIKDRLFMASKHKKCTKSQIDLNAIRYLLISNNIIAPFKKLYLVLARSSRGQQLHFLLLRMY